MSEPFETIQTPELDPSRPTLSLVMTTLGRVEAIGVFLDFLAGQELDGVELIIVDQSSDDRVKCLIAAAALRARVRVISTAVCGISLARNIGMQYARGEIIGFPDDDCWYLPNLLEHIRSWFVENSDADGLSCLVLDEQGRFSAGGYMSHRPQWISKANVWRCAVSPGLFVRRQAVAKIGGFDELLGVGAGTKWGSAEETDFVLRALGEGARVWYNPVFVVGHSRGTTTPNTLRRSWSYGQGMGFVLRRHRYSLLATLYFGVLMWISAAVSLLRLDPMRSLDRITMGLGRWAGWILSREKAATMSFELRL